MNLTETDVRAALLEAGYPELAALTRHNRAGRPAIHLCALGRAPTLAEMTIVCRAFELWYVRFAPEILAANRELLGSWPDPRIWYLNLITSLPDHPRDCSYCHGHPYRPQPKETDDDR